MLATIKNILSLTNIRRERVLPILGHVHARRLQKVTPTNVVVEAQLNPEYILLDIADGLGVPPHRADELLQRQEGDELSQGDVIAGPVGLFQRVIRAPFPGEIKIAGEGKILYQKSQDGFELLAGMEGTVTNIIPERGAIIETKGALIQGVWGNGQITYGVLNSLTGMLMNEVLFDQIDIGHRGAIVAGGFCQDPKVLKNAQAVPIRGLILGSMAASLIPTAQSMDYPILVIDGFGNQPMNPRAAKLLATNNERDIALNAQAYDPYQGNFPEITISLPVSEDLDYPPEADQFKAGQEVYLTSGPAAWKTGTLQRMFDHPQTFPNGVKTEAAEVKLENGEGLLVPLRNLRLLT